MVNNYGKLFGLLNRFNNFTGFGFLDRLKNNQGHHFRGAKNFTNGLPNSQADNISRILNPPNRVGNINQPENNSISNSRPQPSLIYSPESLMKALQNQVEKPETQPSDQSQPETRLVEQKFKNMVKLNLDFNLADFEMAITNLIEKAEEKQVETITLNEIKLGLHVDLKAKAKLEEKYEVTGESDRSHGLIAARTKTRSKSALGVMVRARAFEANMFYRESLRSSYSMKEKYSDGFIRVSRKLAMHYTQDLSFNFKSLSMFNTQAEELDNTDNLEGYINNTEALVDSPQIPGELIGKFFDVVQGYIEKAEAKTIGKINAFYDSVAEQMGIDPGQLNHTKESLINTVTAFFDEVEQAIDSVQHKYVDTNPPVEQIPESEPADVSAEPEIEDQSEPVEQT